MDYLIHNTKSGDRWDLLAMEYYGNAFAIELLLDANPDHANLTLLPSNLALKIPLVSKDELNTQSSGVTTWR